MESQYQEYKALLAALEPEEAVNVLSNRVALINQINSSIADFLDERRRIEERYAADLRRLARRPQQAANNALGIFEMPWQRIVSGTENLAQSHETLASKIQTDVEIPLRQFSSNSRELESISTTQGNLVSLAKDVGRAKDKVDKLNAKGSKKAGDANSEVEDAMRMWESQSPSVFGQLQALDESRLEHLRGVLTQFQTHEADQVERSRASAESCLNALLNIEMTDEIKTFAVKVQQGRITVARRRSSVIAPPRPSSSSNIPPTPPPPRNQDRNSKSAASGDKLGALPETTPHKSKMGGLKRLGTVMRRKSAAPPPPPQPLTEKKKEKRSLFRRGDSSRSFQDLEETGQDLTPAQTSHDRTGSRQGPSLSDDSAQDPRSTAPALLGAPNGLQGPHKSPSDEPPQLQMPLLPENTIAPDTITGSAAGQPSYTISGPPAPAGEDPFAPSTQDTSPFNAEVEDATRNLKIRDEPIQEDASEAQLAMNNMANQLRLQAQTSGVNRSVGSVRGRRDVRSAVFVPGASDAPALTTSPSNILSPPLTSPSASETAAPAPLLSAAAVTSPDPSSFSKRGGSSGILGDDHTTLSDANSIHSAHSLAPGAQHPELHEIGLNASVVETVNTWFSESGVTKSFVVGEVAFSHIAAPNTTPQESTTIRLQNFQLLDRVAANPTFVNSHKAVTAITEDQAGSYDVSLSAIRRTTPTVGLKYQLHLDEANLAQYSPLLVTPAWQIVAGQASIIVLYSLNPAFRLPHTTGSDPQQITLKNVAISVNLNVKDPLSAKPVSAMMAPTTGAAFRRKAGAVVWRFPELILSSSASTTEGQEQQQARLLVRFMTEGDQPAKKGAIEVKFELPDVSASALAVEIQNHHDNSNTQKQTDPFADMDASTSTTSASMKQSSWSNVPTKRMLVSGRYTAI